MGTSVLVIAVILVGSIIGLQLVAWARARAMVGKPVPRLAGPTGARLGGVTQALVYFFSPSCGACVRWTPKFRALSQKNPAVFVVDVMREMELARGLGVMGTPSAVEIAEGKIVAYHVGNIPDELLKRFASSTG
jgi:thioredoxin 1